MRFRTLPALCLTVVGIGACKNDKGISDPVTPAPAATIRFINATVDTGTVDFRFIDKVENLPMLLGVPFRGTSGFFTRVAPGTRPVRIFVNSTDPIEAQKRLVDTTISLSANKRYTLVYAGQARGNQDRLVVIEETTPPPTPPAGNIAIRSLNLDPARPSADVQFNETDTLVAKTPAVTPAPPRNEGPVVATIAAAPYLAYSPYVTMAALPLTAVKDSLYRISVSTAGSGTVAYSRITTQRGVAAGPTYGAQPGIQIAGSVLTALILPGATPGSKAATASNLTPAIVLIADKTLDP